MNRQRACLVIAVVLLSLPTRLFSQDTACGASVEGALVGWWHGSSPGATAFDLSGKGHQGQLIHYPQGVSQGFVFDGLTPGARIDLGDVDAAEFGPLTSLTVTALVNAAGFPQNNRGIVTKYTTDSTEEAWYFRTSDSGGNKVNVGFPRPGYVPPHFQVVTETELIPGTTHCVGFILDRAAPIPTLAVFVDDDFKSEPVPAGVEFRDTAAALTIGNFDHVTNTPTLRPPFHGTIYDVKIYSTALSYQDAVCACHLEFKPVCNNICCLGACCLGTSCLQTTRAYCEGQGGIFHSTETGCSLGNCLVDGKCFPTSEDFCAASGGEFGSCTPK